jgi:1-acyl-sn-glycerol-3-phosphate acyltransferase
MLAILLPSAGLLIIAAVWAKNKARKRLEFWRREGRALQTPGYVPEHPTEFGCAFLRVLSRVATYLTVGTLKVTGREQVQYPASLAVTPNHTHEPDFLVVGAAMRSSFRQLASAAAVRGRRATLAAWTGAFAVPVNNGKARGGDERQSIGSLTAHAGADILQGYREKVLWFPQGQLYDTILPEQFQTGVIRSVKLAGGDVAILPVGIHYLTEPRNRFSRARRAFKFTSYGANVAFGAPIHVSALPEDLHEAIDFIRVEISRLVELAKTL